MDISSSKDKIFLGREKGMIVLNAIKDANFSVKIVSPYLSPDYTKELVKLAEKGVEITLITCDNLEVNRWSDFKHSDVIKQKKIENNKAKETKKKLKKLSKIFILTSLLLLVFSSYIHILIYLSAMLFITSLIFIIPNYFIKEYNCEYYSIFKLKVFDSKSSSKPQSTNLIHSKIFLIDKNTLFLGSANFTYSAFKTHYETVIKVEDVKAIKEIDKEIENIFNSTELKAKSIEDWGKEIYERNI